MEINDPLNVASERLATAGIETARLDAEVLMRHDPQTFEVSLARRAAREPVASITGIKEFWSLPIKVSPAVLIPRPETEHVVERALAVLQARELTHSRIHALTHCRILDLCTGSGCIAAALAKELPHAHFTVTDVSAEALAIAQQNLASAADRVEYLRGDLFAALKVRESESTRVRAYDIITANPPYIADDEWSTLAPEITQYEPTHALRAGKDGLDFIRRIVEDAWRSLSDEGWLVMEIGEGQAERVRELAARVRRYGMPVVTRDLAGKERVISLQKIRGR